MFGCLEHVEPQHLRDDERTMMHTKDNKRALRTLKLSEIERQQKQQE